MLPQRGARLENGRARKVEAEEKEANQAGKEKEKERAAKPKAASGDEETGILGAKAGVRASPARPDGTTIITMAPLLPILIMTPLWMPNVEQRSTNLASCVMITHVAHVLVAFIACSLTAKPLLTRRRTFIDPPVRPARGPLRAKARARAVKVPRERPGPCPRVPPPSCVIIFSEEIPALTAINADSVTLFPGLRARPHVLNPNPKPKLKPLPLLPLLC